MSDDTFRFVVAPRCPIMVIRGNDWVTLTDAAGFLNAFAGRIIALIDAIGDEPLTLDQENALGDLSTLMAPPSELGWDPLAKWK